MQKDFLYPCNSWDYCQQCNIKIPLKFYLRWLQIILMPASLELAGLGRFLAPKFVLSAVRYSVERWGDSVDHNAVRLVVQNEEMELGQKEVVVKEAVMRTR